MKKSFDMEILAPAGSEETLIAAAKNGADAVYLGFGALNARRGAKNFTPESILPAAAYLAERGIKWYLALNTLIFDDELQEAHSVLKAACAAGASGVIIQDLAALALCRAHAPALPVHASTQMSVHNLAGVMQLSEMGFARVVLPRELSLLELQIIGKGAPIELEMFVHGALCMSLSGLCLFSSVAGCRSGNRGLCAQPCRLPMTTGERATQETRALSLRDMSLLTPQYLEALSAAGVSALKIEGRMKRPEYVAAAVTAARLAREGKTPDEQTLQNVFSRGGFTDGYITGRRNGEMFGARSREDVMASQQAQKTVAAQLRHELPRVPLRFSLTMKDGEPATVAVQDGDGHSVTRKGAVPQQARTRPTTSEDVKNCLSKLGGTCYLAEQIHMELAEGLMLPLSALNALRREAVEALSAQRAAVKPVAFSKDCPRPGSPYRTKKSRPGLRAAVLFASQCTPELLEGCEALALYPQELLTLLESPEISPHIHKLMLRQPVASFDEAAFCEALERAAQKGVKQLLASGLSGVKLGFCYGFSVFGGPEMNVANTLALSEYETLGLKDATLSPELSLTRIRALGGALPRGVWGYGRLPLMSVRCCPLQHETGCAGCRRGENILTDLGGRRFPVFCAAGEAQVFNCDPIYLAERQKEFSGIDFFWLSFTTENRGEIAEILKAYQNETPPKGEASYTRGLYYRKVL